MQLMNMTEDYKEISRLDAIDVRQLGSAPVYMC